MNHKTIYLSCPYRSPNHATELYRLQMAYKAAKFLIDKGYLVYNPLAESHGMLAEGAANDWDTWRAYDLAWVDHCDEFAILMIKGWDVSEGVEAELNRADAKNKTMRFLVFDEETNEIRTMKGKEIEGDN